MVIKRSDFLKKHIELGDIYHNISFYRNIEIDAGELNVSENNFEHVIVLSQSCDLERIVDKGANSVLSILVAPIFPLEEFKSGKYLNFLGINEDAKGKGMIQYIEKGEKPRFSLIKISQDDRVKYNIPDDMIIDFRYFFTVDLIQFKQENYKVSLKPFVRELCSQNFANYLSRIGIPTVK